MIVKAVQNKQAADEDLDYVYSRFDIERKAGKTRKLLEFLARVDQTMAPDKLEAQAKSTFLELQKCWQATAIRSDETAADAGSLRGTLLATQRHDCQP